ncbi:MAG: class III extradiol ring-cleavage dioxygenase [Myxococcota bacterium]|nr:class III extradiol ring-cleavage dioxygenase [Myxococcota bacterium]
MSFPTVYIPHGGGPWPWVPAWQEPHAQLRRYLEALPASLPAPKAILVVSAHWEERKPTVTTAAQPGLLYDYGGFPADTYNLSWRAPGSPALAARVRELLGAAGIDSAEEAERGLDHGAFVPLAVSWPKMDIPVVQLSLIFGLDPAAHLELGRALAPLREEGVLILGSGMSYHNMGGFFSPGGQAAAQAFDQWLADSLSSPMERWQSLKNWANAPGGRSSHPREEHLLPLMVIAGAAGEDPVRITMRGQVLGKPVLAAEFGG